MTRKHQALTPATRALIESIVQRDIDGVRAAIQDGADLKALAGGARPLHLAAMLGSGEIVTTLITNGADVDGRDAFGRTAIHYAAMGMPEADANLVQLLIDAGADVNAQDRHGCQPLDLAAGGQIRESAVVLAKAGATCQTDRRSWVQAVSGRGPSGRSRSGR